MSKSKTFFVSDTHFGHERIIELSGRPYADVHEMNAAMTACWNSVVRPEDTVWHLGDFAYRSKNGPETYFHKLHGIKHLIVGNHDGEPTRNLPWASVQQMAEISVDSQRIFLCHYPVLEWPGYHRGAVHLFGHVHGSRPGMPNSLDVGVDAVGFVPIQMPEIMRRLEALRPEDAPLPNSRRR
ncbi:metallophosphoesterase [Aureimonas mangrovi]|uniref:metallophosphoesterase n=1 Tax=Aureimonas mangrovi TaxID=2758041 RepID=UPI00163D9802|nr:metallophosphoesterase [Aureimonas mangrovi]